MDRSRSPQFVRAACAFAALAGLLLGACAPNQSAIDQAVGATRTADKVAADALSSGASRATLSAMSPAITVPPPVPTEAAQAQVCTENMADLKFLSSGYLEGERFLITLQKPQGFQAQFRAEAYTLLVNGSPYACTQVGGNAFRIYCTGRPVPPVGQAQVQLLSADSSCTFEIPFQTVLVPPLPAPPSGGKYGKY